MAAAERRMFRILVARGRCRPTASLQPAALALYRNSGYALVREVVAAKISNKTVGDGIRRYYLEKALA
jgi:hypothetical protein